MRSPYTSLLALSLLAAGSAMTGCGTTSHTVSWQENGIPRHENSCQPWWNYQFVYHPRAQAYYEPYTMTWFWFENGSWWYGEKLPRGVHADNDQAVVVRTNQDLPFLQHQSTTLVLHPWPVDPPLRFDPRHADPFLEQVVSFPVFAPDGVD